MSVVVPFTLKTTLVGTNIAGFDLSSDFVVNTKIEKAIQLQYSVGFTPIPVSLEGITNPHLLLFQSESAFSIILTKGATSITLPNYGNIPTILPIDQDFVDDVDITISTTSVNLIKVNIQAYGEEVTV
jgi:hypothetical protein